MSPLRLLSFSIVTIGLAICTPPGRGQEGFEGDVRLGRPGPVATAAISAREIFAIVSESPMGTELDWVADVLAGSSVTASELQVSVRASGSNRIVVAPGDDVRYEVFGLLSDDANEGLALVGFDLVFDGGDLTPADQPRGVPTPGCDNPMANFTVPWGITNPVGFGGTVIEGDLIQVGGGQNTINNTPDNAPFPIGPVLPGVAKPSACGPAVLVTGRLTVPDVPGLYTLSAMNIFANVIVEGESGERYWATAAAGIGVVDDLVIVVAQTPKRSPARWHGAPFSSNRADRTDLLQPKR